MAKPESAEFETILDLATLEQQLRREQAYAREGHTARTLLREDDLRVVLIVMKAGSRISAHTADETGSIQTLTGRLRLQLPRLGRPRKNRIADLPSGRFLVLDPGNEHGIEAVVDSAFLITFAWKASSRRSDAVPSQTLGAYNDALAAFYGYASNQTAIASAPSVSRRPPVRASVTSLASRSSPSARRDRAGRRDRHDDVQITMENRIGG